MDCIELSIKSLEEKSKYFAMNIGKEFKPDIIIYVARGAVLIGKAMSEFFNVPLIAVGTERKGNCLKEQLAPLLGILPRSVCNILRKIELKTNIHDKYKKREVEFLDNISNYKINDFRNILIVDDSVDTGNSIKAVKELVQSRFMKSTIKMAALNVMSQSKNIVKVDFSLYENVMLRTPMSKDSREYREFLKICRKYTEHHIKDIRG